MSSNTSKGNAQRVIVSGWELTDTDILKRELRAIVRELARRPGGGLFPVRGITLRREIQDRGISENDQVVVLVDLEDGRTIRAIEELAGNLFDHHVTASGLQSRAAGKAEVDHA